MQVDPIKPTLKVPGSKRLKLMYDEPLSSFALNSILRRYVQAVWRATLASLATWGSAAAGYADGAWRAVLSLGPAQAVALEAAALALALSLAVTARRLFVQRSVTPVVGRCRLTLSNRC